jgi:predicted regulator of Ras-like GTPase activity (Roadblock/LC7/MglB family)
MNWGRPTQSTDVSTATQEKGQEILSDQDQQVITRSLSEKFGVSGANSALTQNQPLTLAESIRQKISEMSKTGGDHVAPNPASDDSSHNEPIDEWAVPHSPDWPKLNVDTAAEQWPNEPAGSKAPNAWGSSGTGWSVRQPAVPAEQVSDLAINNTMPDYQVDAKHADSEVLLEAPGTTPSIRQKEPTWSAEAEQLETGNWDTVQFATTLSATNSSTSLSPPLPPLSQPVSESISEPVSQSSSLPESLLAPPSVGKQVSQSFRPASPATGPKISPVTTGGGPKIYPVVSKRAQALIASSHAGVGEPSMLNLPAQVQAETLAAAAPSTPASPSLPDSSSATPSALPAPSQSAPPQPSNLPTASESLPSSNVPDKPRVATEVDKSRLFNFDDGAIDQLFSNNLGVYERAVPAQPETTVSPPATSTPSPASAASSMLPVASTPPPASAASSMPPVASTPPPAPAASSMLPVASTPPPAPAASSMLPVASTPPSETASSSPPVLAPVPESKADNLFVIDDNMIDRIFTDALGVSDQANKNVVSAPPSNKPQSMPSEEEKGDFSAAESSISVAKEILLSSSSAAAQPPMQEAKKNTTKFGPVSPTGYSSGKQKIAGVGRLDDRAGPQGEPGSGRIASIGKFLLDNKDLEKIGRITASDLSDSNTRTLTLEANEELKNLLQQIDAQHGVTGTVIVGHDGLLIANTIAQDTDAESLGVWALGVYMGTSHVIEKLGDDHVRQIVSQTNQGYLIIANFGAGLLITLTNPIGLDSLLPLMRTITQLVAA